MVTIVYFRVIWEINMFNRDDHMLVQIKYSYIELLGFMDTAICDQSEQQVETRGRMQID